MKQTPNALVVHGGWEGHQPSEIAALYREWLASAGFSVTVADTLDAFADEDLASYRLLVPIWTMGTIERRQLAPVLAAVAAGVGLAGCHGGMCDAFRNEPDWQFLAGGQWVAHPGNDGVRYTVDVRDPDHPIVQGVASSFEIESEQYYLHVDPAIRVLATTRFPVADGPHWRNGRVDMPVVWTKYYGEGRVFYNALGHTAEVAALPDVARLNARGCLWAARILP